MNNKKNFVITVMPFLAALGWTFSYRPLDQFIGWVHHQFNTYYYSVPYVMGNYRNALMYGSYFLFGIATLFMIYKVLKMKSELKYFLLMLVALTVPVQLALPILSLMGSFGK